MPALLVNEVFLSLQGEGVRTGLPSVFIRLQGCRVGCPWCDTGYARTTAPQDRLPDNDGAVFAKTSASPSHTCAQTAWLVRGVLALARPGMNAVITGGEPCEQGIAHLTTALCDAGFSVQVETSGTCPILCDARAWVTLSPKARPVLPENWKRADEIKLPVLTIEDIARHAGALERLPANMISLQPVSGTHAATALCVRECLRRNWRLSLQTQKFINLR
ncbi:MAG: 7-carboxy-7-deazaguanine synthase QueE [Desulfovibrio sp.]|nr:7-carboxy-7-deazaguanine synthase QueE [Desulfovibrio sp.]